jgi:hypothetical protein
MQLVGAAAAALVVSFARAIPPWAPKIPSAYAVTGVLGHTGRPTYANANSFGWDLKKANLSWAVLCPMDSDGDGKKNGEELGDPFCTWTVGSPDPKVTGVTDPGIADSLPLPTPIIVGTASPTSAAPSKFPTTGAPTLLGQTAAPSAQPTTAAPSSSSAAPSSSSAAPSSSSAAPTGVPTGGEGAQGPSSNVYVVAGSCGGAVLVLSAVLLLRRSRFSRSRPGVVGEPPRALPFTQPWTTSANRSSGAFPGSHWSGSKATAPMSPAL